MIFLRAIFAAHKWRPRSTFLPARRPLTLHPVAGGGCDGCLVESMALQGAAYDLVRHDIRFVDTPHDAELLFVTGAITRAMVPALAARWAAMPSPKGIIAVGDCAVGSGPFGENYAVLSGVMEAGLGGVQQCDVALRGCPPAPAEILQALLSLTMGRSVTA